jgi:hypothetical protein
MMQDSRGAMLQINEIIQTPVGADLSRPPPMYRLRGFHNTPLNLLMSIIVPHASPGKKSIPTLEQKNNDDKIV